MRRPPEITSDIIYSEPLKLYVGAVKVGQEFKAVAGKSIRAAEEQAYQAKHELLGQEPRPRNPAESVAASTKWLTAKYVKPKIASE